LDTDTPDADAGAAEMKIAGSIFVIGIAIGVAWGFLDDYR
jgi:hypothetical protein